MASAFKGRREDDRLVTGRGRYSDDWHLPGELYASFKRSDRAHARVVSLSVQAAREAPGVVAIVTGSDIAAAGFRTLLPIAPLTGRDGKKMLIPERPLLVQDRVRFAGEEVAMVVAQSHAAARDAADLIEVEFEELPAVIGFEKALARGAIDLHPNIPGNICFDFEYGDAAKAEELIGRAACRARVGGKPARCADADGAARRARLVRCRDQNLRDALRPSGRLCDAGFARSHDERQPAKIRVNMVDVGGAFGARTASVLRISAHAVSWRRQLGRPIKWLSTRSEDFLTDNHGRAIRLEGELAFDGAGRFIALRTELAVRFRGLPLAGRGIYQFASTA